MEAARRVRKRELARVLRGEYTNVLVIHGTSEERARFARQLHLTPGQAFVQINCEQEGANLHSTLRAWIAEDGCAPEPAALLGSGCGTLFLDAVETLSLDCQRLLLVFLERLAEATASGHKRPIGRLVAGNQVSLERAVAEGRFIPQLCDALDKARVDLQESPSEHVGSDRAL